LVFEGERLAVGVAVGEDDADCVLDDVAEAVAELVALAELCAVQFTHVGLVLPPIQTAAPA
jgi:hypothetical protein